jgi:hypothetical protein
VLGYTRRIVHTGPSDLQKTYQDDRVARGAMELIDRLGGPRLEWVVTCRRA